MPMSQCKTCKQMRAKSGEQECPVCWLIRELKREHAAGDHERIVNASCVTCTRAREPIPVPPAVKRQKIVERGLGSHARCRHEATPSERAKCRKRRAKA